MKKPLFFWSRNVLRTYAQVHVTSSHEEQVLQNAYVTIRQFPLKYYLTSLIAYFFIEFAIPSLHGNFSRFSHLPQTKVFSLIERLQNSSLLTLKILVNLLRIPVLLSLKKEYLKESSHEI